MSGGVLLYGATGYSGREIACRLAPSVPLTLAGRDAGKLRAVAEPLGVPWLAFGVDDVAAMRAAVQGHTLVLNAAGPFVRTALPLADACIAMGVHYLDLAGEWPVFVALMARDAAARAAGVMVLPGVGWTVAAGDCLMASAVDRWPDTRRLCLGISRAQVISRGSVVTAASLIEATALVRRDGALVQVPSGSLTRAFDFGDGLREGMAMSWADVVTGGVTTGVPAIEVYTQVRWYERASCRATGAAMAATGPAPWRAVSSAAGRLWPQNPRRDHKAEAGFTLVVEALDPWRRARRMRLRTLDGYGATVLLADEAVRRVLAGTAAPGFRTPARVFGADFIEAAGAGRFEQMQARSAA